MKKLLVVVVALVILAAVAFGVRTLGARDETDAVNSKDAAKLVQDEDADATDIAPGERPKAGTYTYTGSGRESVSALGRCTFGRRWDHYIGIAMRLHGQVFVQDLIEALESK